VETEVASNSERLAAGSSQAVQEAHRRFILIGSASVVLLVLFNTYLWSTTKKIKENLKKEIAHKEMEMSNKLNQEKEFIKKDLDEKYRADLVSYQAMSKRLEIEKNRVKELEEKTNKK
jgi:hypothetical protein